MKAYLTLVRIPQMVETGTETGIMKILIIPNMKLEILVRDNSVKFELMQETIGERTAYLREHGYPVTEVDLDTRGTDIIGILSQAHEDMRALLADIEKLSPVPVPA